MRKRDFIFVKGIPSLLLFLKTKEKKKKRKEKKGKKGVT